MMSALIMIGVALAICLAATPFLLVIWLLSKWATWVQGMVNGEDKKDESKEVLKLLGKLLTK